MGEVLHSAEPVLGKMMVERDFSLDMTFLLLKCFALNPKIQYMHKVVSLSIPGVFYKESSLCLLSTPVLSATLDLCVEN